MALGIVAFAAPGLLPAYGVDIYVLALIFGLLAIGLDVLMGYAGLDSLAQAAFFGVATFTVGILTVRNGAPWLLAAPIAVLVSAALAASFGLLAVRLKGLFFLLITLALGQVLWGASLRWGDFTGGFNGLSGVPRPFPQVLRDPVVFAYCVLVVFLVVAGTITFMMHSPLGLALKGVRDNETRLSTLGFRPYWLKWLAFVIAGTVAAIAGVINATYNQFVGPSDLSLQLSFAVMLMVILGGGGNIGGALLGAVVVTILQNELSIILEDWWLVVMGGVYLLTTLFLPHGLMGALRRFRRDGGLSPIATRDGAVATTRPPELHPSEGEALATEARVGGLGTVLELQGVSKAFGGIRVLDDISLKFELGERAGIIGPNGAGKTTLFNLVTGLVQPTGGKIMLLGSNVTGRPPHERPALGMSRTFQITRLFQPLTVLENMMLGLLGWSMRRYQYAVWQRTSQITGLQRRARAQLDRVGLLEFRDTLVRHLSYGHQKQLDIAIALAGEPKIMLLDEPTAGLSQDEAARVLDLVRSLPATMTVIVIEHNLDFVFGLTHRLVVLDHGRVLMDGGQREVRGSEEVRRIYFGEPV